VLSNGLKSPTKRAVKEEGPGASRQDDNDKSHYRSKGATDHKQ
jgi:hypothetical protein